MGSLKSPCTTSYRSSSETIAINCLVFEKIAFLHFGDRQTKDRQTDGQAPALSRCRCRERRLNELRQKSHRRDIELSILITVVKSMTTMHNVRDRWTDGLNYVIYSDSVERP